MTSPSPALLELMSRVINGDASGEDLLRQIESIRAEAENQPPGYREESADRGAADPGGAGRAVSAAPGEPVASDLVSRGPQSDRACAIPGATVDLGRQARCGFSEVIYGEGKSAELVARIIRTQLDAGQSSLVTRMDSGVAFQVRQCFEFAYHNPVARTLRVTLQAEPAPIPLTPRQASRQIHAAVVTAGSTDAPVAEEAIETLHWMGVPLQRFEDIGVAGPQRLAAALPALRLASTVVVVAGMEGALPAVIAGHLSVPVFAVPTSVGYGANLGGLTALMSMLSTCSASVAVVNIDSGFKGGYMAGLVTRQLERLSQRLKEQPFASQQDRIDSPDCEIPPPLREGGVSN